MDDDRKSTSRSLKVSDYSATELNEFTRRFASAAAHYRRWMRRWWIGWVVIFVVVLPIGLFAFSAHPEYGMLPLFAAILVQAVSVLWYPKPMCPACDEKLELNFGSYCPQCGQLGFDPSIPSCPTCGKLDRLKSGRCYKIHYCSSCGIPVDVKGF